MGHANKKKRAKPDMIALLERDISVCDEDTNVFFKTVSKDSQDNVKFSNTSPEMVLYVLK